jgi:membrane-associated phospholipid phosphatase
MNAMGLALVYWLDFNETLRESSDGNEKIRSYWTRGFLFFVAIMFGGTIGYSRLYLGVHSMD